MHLSDKDIYREAIKSLVAHKTIESRLSPSEIAELVMDMMSLYESKKMATCSQQPIVSDMGTTAQVPAVSIENSVQDDYIICLEDGRRCKMLKRYIGEKYGMSPDEYRNKWGLPSDYPMTAPSYSRLKAATAKTLGLGQYERQH